MLNPEPVEELRRAVVQLGPDVAVIEPRRALAIVRDRAGGHPREIMLLQHVADDGGLPDLLRGGQAAIARITTRLADRRGLDREKAVWAVNAWAYALGIDAEPPAALGTTPPVAAAPVTHQPTAPKPAATPPPAPWGEPTVMPGTDRGTSSSKRVLVIVGIGVLLALSLAAGITALRKSPNDGTDAAPTPPCGLPPPGLPQMVFVTGSEVSADAPPSLPYETTWKATDATGVVQYDVERQVNNGPWESVIASTERLEASSEVAVGSSYTYRVRAVQGDCSSEWTSKATFRVDLYQQDQANDSGDWTFDQGPEFLDGNAKSTIERGAWASFGFHGSNIAVVGSRGPAQGAFEVLIDGEPMNIQDHQVSGHSPGEIHRVVLARYGWPVPDEHTLRIVNRATRGHPELQIDGFVVLR
jgi:hypothetical protein